MRKALASSAWIGAVVVLLVVSFAAGRAVRTAVGHVGSVAVADESEQAQLEARAERIMEDGEETGRVYLNDKLLFTIQTTAGGLTGYERAMIVAKRLNDAFAAGTTPEEFTASVVQGINAVVWRDKVLITVDDAQARKLGKERAQVAEEWAAAIRTAMRQILGLPEPAAETGQQAAGGAEPTEWRPPEPYDNKDVPIVTVGEGKQIGIARVKGPRSKVRLVQAVAAIETHYKKVLEIEIYVPISTKVPGRTLSRIQGVGVVGIVKYRL